MNNPVIRKVVALVAAAFALGILTLVALDTMRAEPKPMDESDKLVFAQILLEVQASQTRVLQAQQGLTAAVSMYRERLSEMQAKYEAAGCLLNAQTLDWNCNPPQRAVTPPPEEEK
jgi:hypothetical protein